MLNILTANCIRHLERLAGQSYRQLVELIESLIADLFDNRERIYWRRTALNCVHTDIWEKLQTKPPPTS